MGQRMFTLESTLIGYVLNDLTWCGMEKLPGVNFNSCPAFASCEHHTMASFWAQASESYARQAEGVVTVMLNGSIPSRPAYRNNSFFAEHELPNFDPNKVTKMRVWVIHDLDKEPTETCGQGSIQILEQIAKARGLYYECEDNPTEVVQLLCVDNPKHPDCTLVTYPIQNEPQLIRRSPALKRQSLMEYFSRSGKPEQNQLIDQSNAKPAKPMESFARNGRPEQNNFYDQPSPKPRKRRVLKKMRLRGSMPGFAKRRNNRLQSMNEVDNNFGIIGVTFDPYSDMLARYRAEGGNDDGNIFTSNAKDNVIVDEPSSLEQGRIEVEGVAVTTVKPPTAEQQVYQTQVDPTEQDFFASDNVPTQDDLPRALPLVGKNPKAVSQIGQKPQASPRRGNDPQTKPQIRTFEFGIPRENSIENTEFEEESQEGSKVLMKAPADEVIPATKAGYYKEGPTEFYGYNNEQIDKSFDTVEDNTGYRDEQEGDYYNLDYADPKLDVHDFKANNIGNEQIDNQLNSNTQLQSNKFENNAVELQLGDPINDEALRHEILSHSDVDQFESRISQDERPSVDPYVQKSDIEAPENEANLVHNNIDIFGNDIVSKDQIDNRFQSKYLEIGFD